MLCIVTVNLPPHYFHEYLVTLHSNRERLLPIPVWCALQLYFQRGNSIDHLCSVVDLKHRLQRYISGEL